MADPQESRFMEALKVIGTVTGLIGGGAGVFAIVGYVIILGFANETGLYGRTYFTQQLPFEALFTAMYDWLKFCGRNLTNLGIFLSVSLCVTSIIFFDALTGYFKNKRHHPVAPVPAAQSGTQKTANTGTMTLAVMAVFGFIVVILTMYAIGHYDFQVVEIKTVMNTIDDYLLYTVAFPLSAGMFIVLLTQYKTTFPKTKAPSSAAKTWYNITATTFVLIVLLMPFLYGTAFYDLPVYQTRNMQLSGRDSTLVHQKQYKLMTRTYLVGQGTDRDLFLSYNPSRQSWWTTSLPKDSLRRIDLVYKKPRYSSLPATGVAPDGSLRTTTAPFVLDPSDSLKKFTIRTIFSIEFERTARGGNENKKFIQEARMLSRDSATELDTTSSNLLYTEQKSKNDPLEGVSK
jgi:hypothetical protein